MNEINYNEKLHAHLYTRAWLSYNTNYTDFSLYHMLIKLYSNAIKWILLIKHRV